jgi:PBSX family phage terminase large subunit
LKDDSKPKKHLHFYMNDNPILGDDEIKRAEMLFAGVFYQRFVLGEWVLSEGLVYDFGEPNIVDETPKNGEYYISIDYGTLNPFSAGLWCVLGDKATRIKEYYYNGREKSVQRTDEEYCDDIQQLAKDYKIKQVIVDPSAASFIAALRKRGFVIRKANNEVLDGIRRTAVYLKNGNIKIHRSCADSISEFGLYRWDDKATTDTVIKENDHAMDEIRYFCNTVMKNKVGKTAYIPLMMR